MQLNYLLKYLKYKITAKHKGGHGIHSPFVFELLTNVIEHEANYYAFEKINELRYKLSENKEEIQIKDYGEGSKKMSKKRRICDIMKHSSVSEKFGELLFRLVNRFSPKNILEIGTAIGISTSYIALPNSKSKIISLEGCPTVAAKARENINYLQIKNVEIIEGKFEDTIDKALAEFPTVDFVFFDGNHRKEATINYFEKTVTKTNNNTLFIFDDIHWSEGMEQAWEHIKKDNRVIVTIDLFFFGMVFFRKEMQKQNFIINF